MTILEPSHDLLAGLLRRLAAARRTTDALFALLPEAALRERPIRERHRILFYLGHLEAFDWNVIGRGALGREPVRESWDQLFAFGIDPLDGEVPDEPADAWPPASEIRDYGLGVRTAIDDCLTSPDRDVRGHPFIEDGSALHIAIEHRLLHAETLCYMLHRLPVGTLHGGAGIDPLAGAGGGSPPPAEAMAVIPRGIARLGLSDTNRYPYGWDNEKPPLEVEVPEFAIDVHPVTNGGFLEFVRAGGYRDRGLWEKADWEWREEAGIEHPSFWRPREVGFRLRTFASEIPLPLDWPVHVTYAEASAFSRYAGKALPSEAEWQRAAYGTREGEPRRYPWGDEEPGAEHGNFGMRRWDPEPVAAHRRGTSAFGVADLLGNGWEWTATRFAPLPGFTPHPLYRGYSANSFDDRHHVLKGGSARTAVELLRPSFRNWFQPRYPYIYSGFRCVRR